MDAFLIDGQVMHERLRPWRNRFVYRIFCLRVRLDRLDVLTQRWFGVDCWRPLSLYRRDYGPRDGSDLSVWMQALLAEHGLPPASQIWLQTFPRVFGYAFNPVSFWYCHDADQTLRAVLAEVNNTFGERHCYLLTAADRGPLGEDSPIHCRKLMHVSPFCRVVGHYQFRLRERPTTALMSIDYYDNAGLLIRTAVGGHRHPFSAANLRRAVLGRPWLTLAIIARIHWQALRLWWHKVPFFRKPEPPRQGSSRSVETAKPDAPSLPIPLSTGVDP
ncbi:DUF1365 domain-containing protein [Parachitinimonas caeni]|uniref:DUF1365 domain-containing protein n=1 Tax=Parachitinimonas caeni TaxID=3031301 RepID=A0ABT7E060_9NEIS|nr:DUF1365 domain-containing protein [Parachitinimonas caeni]MDK2124733.1 DUF1365 domain-containing protein [Parachitinimonas caeni]